MNQRLPLRVLPLLALLPLLGCPKPAAPPTPPITDRRLANPQVSASDDAFGVMGNPDNATHDPRNPDHYLMPRPEFVVSYNDSLRFPNWVAWRLCARDIGDTERGKFVADPDLPNAFTHITTRDYASTGYDRGHNCPSKDRSASREINDVAFYMSNITPQKHGMNAGPWEGLETYSRVLAKEGNELYILCGHGFESKDPTRAARIGRNAIAVPDFGWKILLVLPEQRGNDLARISAETRVIAVKMPNDESISHDPWDKYLTTVGELEQATDLTFFANLPPEVAQALKRKRDGGKNSFAGGTSGFQKGKGRR